jgi:hypothetical protein
MPNATAGTDRHKVDVSSATAGTDRHKVDVSLQLRWTFCHKVDVSNATARENKAPKNIRFNLFCISLPPKNVKKYE